MRKLLKAVDIPPGLSLLLAGLALLIVLVNNHVYLKGLEDKSMALQEQKSKLTHVEEGLDKRERTLNSWELALIDRARQLSKDCAARGLKTPD